MGQALSHLLPASPDNTFLSFMSLSLISTFTGLVTTIPGVPTVLSPMAADFAQLTGFTLPAVLMTQVIGFSTVVFPYQVAPLNESIGQPFVDHNNINILRYKVDECPDLFIVRNITLFTKSPITFSLKSDAKYAHFSETLAMQYIFLKDL